MLEANLPYLSEFKVKTTKFSQDRMYIVTLSTETFRKLFSWSALTETFAYSLSLVLTTKSCFYHFYLILNVLIMFSYEMKGIS
jgi:hypothetical protein